MAKGDSLIRLVKMILLIEVHPGLSAKELAKKCGVSERQIFRYIQVSCYAGIPIYPENGYRLLSKSGLQKISLTLEEALALIYGLKLLEKQKGFLYSGAGVKEKLLEILPEQLRHEVEDIQKQIAVSVDMSMDYTGKDNLFKRINTAIHNGQCLNMEYYSFNSGRVTNRKIDPYQLVFRDGFWYLAAYCHLHSEVRLFRVDRIQRLEYDEKIFSKLVDFDLDTYIGSAWQMERGAEYTFKVHFRGDAARYVRETRFHPSQQITSDKEDVVIFTAKACGLKSVARWILQFGGEAEVLEPGKLREYVKEQLTEALQNYRKI